MSHTLPYELPCTYMYKRYSMRPQSPSNSRAPATDLLGEYSGTYHPDTSSLRLPYLYAPQFSQLLYVEPGSRTSINTSLYKQTTSVIRQFLAVTHFCKDTTVNIHKETTSPLRPLWTSINRIPFHWDCCARIWTPEWYGHFSPLPNSMYTCCWRQVLYVLYT
jgi:hypothetical protein